ncbi:response regulator [Patescibacteria group bacterium]|nr:response regulator [Patescibacteria group bacterium]MBU1034829.1 response regulator [Patescibacteria group bacterium]MBU1629887.1 response regulator [Patescibacteria group bacterium]
MSKPLILLIEDDGFLASIYAQKLELEGFSTALANNGEDGLKLVKKDRPVLIMLDLLMPKMDGFETLEALKKDPETVDIPVLVLTNLGQKEDIERCMALGASGYAIKAHSLPGDTVKKVKEILGMVS